MSGILNDELSTRAHPREAVLESAVQAYRSLRSVVCPACGYPKTAGFALCRRCAGMLSAEGAKHLHRFSNFRPALEAMLAELGVVMVQMEPNPF